MTLLVFLVLLNLTTLNYLTNHPLIEIFSTNIKMVTFSDINECVESPCSQGEECKNTVGSYQCVAMQCLPGFELLDGVCTGISLFYIVHSHRIYTLNKLED